MANYDQMCRFTLAVRYCSLKWLQAELTHRKQSVISVWTRTVMFIPQTWKCMVTVEYDLYLHIYVD